ncbi:hypothetical protein CsatB_002315 [Cannabis sativa]
MSEFNPISIYLVTGLLVYFISSFGIPNLFASNNSTYLEKFTVVRNYNYGFGCVARGADGRIIEAISGSRLGVVGPEIAEVIGVKEALSWIKRNGWMEVEIETDALVVVQAVMGSIQMPSQFGFLVQDCRNLLSCINQVSLHFVKRSANRVAHCLARASCYHSDCIVSEDTAPLELMSIVDVECL